MRRRAGARVVLAWDAADREGVRRWLIAAGFAPLGRRCVGIPGLEIEVREPMPGRSSAERLRLIAVAGPEGRAAAKPVRRDAPGDATAPTRPVAAGDPASRDLPAVAIATVDLERAIVAFGGLAGPPADDPLLGARIAASATPGILVAEPFTEGRLAATLARHGEGPAVVYLATAIPSAELRIRLAAAGAAWRTGGGPFGPAVLATGGARWGPHLVIVPTAADPPPSDVSATIEP